MIMKKLAFYMSLIVTGLLMVACSEDFKDWKAQQTYLPESAITIPGYTASAASAAGIDLNTIEDATVQLVNLTGEALPDGYMINSIRAYIVPVDDATAEPVVVKAADEDGCFSVADLQEAIVGFYGVRPTARTFKAHIYADAVKDGQGALIDAGEVQLTLTPIAPVIETAYYYVGATNGWSDSDKTYKFDNGGGDVYENPVFTVTVPAPYKEDGTRDDNWFKIAPESAYTSGDFWNNLVGVENHGDEATEGKLVVGKGFDVGAFKQPATDEATMYRISINMLEQTYTITPIMFKVEPAYYYVGAVNGWSDSDKTYVFSNGGVDPLINPIYTCIVPAPYKSDGTRDDNWFKIAPESAYTSGNFWNNLFGVENDGDEATTGNLAFGNPGAFKQPASDGASMYRISINVKEMTYEIKPLVSAPLYYVVGGVQGWSDKNKICLFTPEEEMNILSYTTKWTGAWDLKIWDADNFGNWDAAWGCVVDGDNSPSGSLINSGAQAISAPSADYYTFTINMNTMTYTWTKLDNQAPTEYESISLIGEFNGWGGDFDLEQVTPHNWYGLFTQENDGQLKYRANHDWAKNWGYGSDKDWNVAEGYNKIGTNGGGNIWVPAGTYAVYLNDITNSMLIIAQ